MFGLFANVYGKSIVIVDPSGRNENLNIPE